MAKRISCEDAGADCKWSAVAETEEQLIAKTIEHVKEHHKDLQISPELTKKLKSLMKEV